MNKTLLTVLVVAIVVGGGAFYGGMKYGQSTRQNFAWQNLGGQDLSPEQRQQRLQQTGLAGIGFRDGRSGGSDFASGEIISKDDESITIKMGDAGSKIIFYSESTEVGKFVNGTPSDLEIGKTVSINGKANQDGSITAKSIQLRPVITPTP